MARLLESFAWSCSLYALGHHFGGAVSRPKEGSVASEWLVTGASLFTRKEKLFTSLFPPALDFQPVLLVSVPIEAARIDDSCKRGCKQSSLRTAC